MINDCNGGISNRPDGEIRRFSPVYKQSLEQIEMSEELRSRILSTVPAIASKNPKKQWIKAAGGLAACLVAVVAAGSLVPRMEFSLTVEDNAACETVSSAAATAEAPPIGMSGDGEASPEEAPAGTAVSESAAGGIDSGTPAGQPETDAAPEAESSPDTGSEGEEGSPETAEPAETGYADASGEAGTAPAGNGISLYGAGEDSLSPSQATSESAGDGAEAREAGGTASSGSGSANALLPNPAVSYPSAEEAFAALGWAVTLPEGVSGSVSVTDGSLFQLDMADGGCYRAGETRTWGEDVSGDFNSYAYDVRIETDGLSLRLRGEEAGQATLISWTDGSFSYSYAAPAAMTEEEAITFAKSISG